MDVQVFGPGQLSSSTFFRISYSSAPYPSNPSQRISARVTKFYTSPELGCGLIRSMTISELLSNCSNQQLLTMGQGIDVRAPAPPKFPLLYQENSQKSVAQWLSG